jgi:hypothetical protein
MTAHVTHVIVRDDGPPMQPQRVGAVYAIPGPEFKTYVPDYAPNKDALDALDEDEASEVETKVITSTRRPRRPKTTATAETKRRPRPRRTRSADDEGAGKEE